MTIETLIEHRVYLSSHFLFHRPPIPSSSFRSQVSPLSQLLHAIVYMREVTRYQPVIFFINFKPASEIQYRIFTTEDSIRFGRAMRALSPTGSNENRQKLRAFTSSEYRSSGTGKSKLDAASPTDWTVTTRAHTCSLLSRPCLVSVQHLENRGHGRWFEMRRTL